MPYPYANQQSANEVHVHTRCSRSHIPGYPTQLSRKSLTSASKAATESELLSCAWLAERSCGRHALQRAVGIGHGVGASCGWGVSFHAGVDITYPSSLSVWHRWYALHAQFNSFSIGLRRDIVNGATHVSGGITSADRHAVISKVDLETGFADIQTQIPVRATPRIYGGDGSHHTLRSSLISPSSLVGFSRPFQGGTTELFEDMVTHKCEETSAKGTGLMEWLFTHPKK